jgi:hypothetical protein
MNAKKFFLIMLLTAMLALPAQAALADTTPPDTVIYLGQEPGANHKFSYTHKIYATVYNYDAESAVTSCQINWGAGWETVDKGTEASWYSVAHTYPSAGIKTVYYRCSSAGGISSSAFDKITVVQDITPPSTGIYLGGAPGAHNNKVYSKTVYANLWNYDAESAVTSCVVNWNAGEGWEAVSTGTALNWYSVAHTYSDYGAKTVSYRCSSAGGATTGSIQHTNLDFVQLLPASQAPLQIFTKILHLPRQIMKVSRLFFTEECVEPGQELRLISNLDIGRDLRNVKITATVAELGLRKRLGPFNLEKDKAKSFYVAIPEDAPEGKYDLRVSISNADFRRVKHRTFTVKNTC